MDLKPIIADLNKQAFTMPGLNAYELVPLHEVIQILEAHLGFYEEEGSTLIHFPNGKVIEKTNSGKERVIKEPEIKKLPDVEAKDEKPEAEAALPPEILANLGVMGPSAVVQHPSDRPETPPGTAPARPSDR